MSSKLCDQIYSIIDPVQIDSLEDFNKQRNKPKRRSLFGFRKKRDKVSDL